MKNHKLILLTGGTILTSANCLAGSKPEKKPNIVVFLIDDFGWKDLGCYGSTYYQTPNIDKMASEGVKFTNAYSACTVSSPSRAALQTGKYPAKLHLTDWIPGNGNEPNGKLNIPQWSQFLSLYEKTAAESLKEVGYATWHVGKWHLGEEEKYWAENQGFDVNIAGNHKGQPIKTNDSNGYFSPYGLPRIENGPVGEYLTDRLTDEALKLIENNKNKPFYLNFCHYAVHTPLMGKADKVAKFKQFKDPSGLQKNAVYAAMIESVDESVGMVLKKLKEKNLLENTMVVFASDNGGLTYTTSNSPLKQGKGWAYEGGTRTPLIVYWKGKIQGARTIAEPAITMDIYSTILDVAGVKQGKDVDGKSLFPVIQNNKKYNRALYWHYPHYHLDNPYGSVRYGDWKLIQYFEDNHLELYNLKTDLSENQNLATANPAKAKQLLTMMRKWRTKVDAQMPTVNPNYDPSKK